MTEAAPEIWHSPSERVTQELAARFAERLRDGGHVALEGDLGAGKTCFAKGVIAALTGVPPDEIPSPTFTLVEEYPGRLKVYHVDLYRMNHPAEA
ncbi:MAG TPA: tRNA (adenosine(37)-N6)-threonylcarbamoyltransferase complex ATPase subunit type 1 TsaE, partial [bacterium]|nr:tRNA (adenosine(37)-N6)-threonylcarbamoyltransferase complex ATPase subunit type 1 TsaE [bacterium]